MPQVPTVPPLSWLVVAAFLLSHCSVSIRDSQESLFLPPEGSSAAGDGGSSTKADGGSSKTGDGGLEATAKDAAADQTARGAAGVCRNGVVEGHEECDSDSPFCFDCLLAPLPDGFSCWSEDNNMRFFFHVPRPPRGLTPTWNNLRDFCEDSLAHQLDGIPFSYYGLAGLWDRAVYDCVVAKLDQPGVRENFYVGLRMTGRDRWEWVFRNSAHQRDALDFGPVEEFEPRPWLGHDLETKGCASFHADPGNSEWEHWHLDEDPCDSLTDGLAQPLCMVAF